MAAEDHKEAQQDYEDGMKYKDIAEKYSVSINTVKSWQKRFKWERKKGAPKTKKGCTQNHNRVHPELDPPKKKKRGAPKGSKNALGNKGGPGGPKGNDHATKHGFFKRILPDDPEVHAIVEEIGKMSPLEILWHDIQLQMAIIARAQTLMYVKNQDDITEYLKRERRGRNPEKEYELQFAWDKHATLMNAQSRAMQTLERLIARYEELLLKELDTEEQQLRIDKLRAEIEKIKSPDDVDIQNYLDALQHAAHDVWADEPNEEKEEDNEGEADE